MGRGGGTGSVTENRPQHKGAQGRRAPTPGRAARHHVGVTRIGILTGGGDVPGLNSIIKSVVYRGWEIGWETIGIRRGWKGLTHLGPAGAR